MKIDIEKFIMDVKVTIVYQNIEGKFIPVSAYCWIPLKKERK